MPYPIYTVGSSNLSWAMFAERLEAHEIGCVADVRSFPRSRLMHFCQPHLKACLNRRGVAYAHLGDQLGGHVCDEALSYTYRTTLPEFISGIERVLAIAARCRVALCCSEGEVLDCHRFVILSRYLAQRSDAQIIHILRDGQAETHKQTEDRLLHRMGLATDLFRDRGERLSLAYAAKMARMGLLP